MDLVISDVKMIVYYFEIRVMDVGDMVESFDILM